MFAIIFVCIVSLIIFFIVAIVTRGSSFEGAGTSADAAKQVVAAANFSRWRWPSVMHEYAYEKTRMKDVGVLLLVLMQRVLRDKNHFYSVVMVSNFASAISSVLIYIISESLWSGEVAIILFLLYAFSFWPYQIVLHGGYHVVAQMYALISVYCMFQVNDGYAVINVLWYFLAGVSITLMMFSSASSRKYLLFVFSAFFYSNSLLFPEIQLNQLGNAFSYGPVRLYGMVFLVIGLFLLIMVKVNSKRIVETIYNKNGLYWLSGLMKNSEGGTSRDMQRISDVIANQVFWYAFFCFLFILPFWASMFLIGYQSKICYLLVLISGLVTSGFFFVYPKIVDSIRGYFRYSDMRSCGHFNCVKDYFQKIGEQFVDGQRAGNSGWRWLVRFFPRMVPFHIALFLGGFIVIALKSFLVPLLYLDTVKGFGVLLISFSPVIMGEVTRGPQIARAYFPGLLGVLLWIGYSVSVFYSIIGPVYHELFFGLVIIYVVISSVWNTWVFIDDILPSRMVVARLRAKLDELGIHQFCTYDTSFNHWFVGVLKSETPNKYEINYIKSLDEVKDGFVVVPGTSWKASNVVGVANGITATDFKSDKTLNHLIDSKDILKCSIKSFKNMGTSRKWVHEDEVTSYRELLLKDITEYDRWRALGWIIDVPKLRKLTIL